MASTALAAMFSGRSPYFYNTISCFRVYHQPVASYFKCLDYLLIIFIYLKNFPFILSFSTSMSRYSSCHFHDFAYAERTSKDDILVKAFFPVRSSGAVPFHVHSSFRSCQSRCGRKGKTLAFTQPIVVGAELFVLQVQRTVALTVTFFADLPDSEFKNVHDRSRRVAYLGIHCSIVRTYKSPFIHSKCDLQMSARRWDMFEVDVRSIVLPSTSGFLRWADATRHTRRQM